MPEVIELDRPPRNRLPAAPEITSEAEADQAFEEIGWIESRQATVVAGCEAEVALVRAKWAKKLLIPVEGQPVKFTDRLKALRSALLTFARTHRGELLAGQRGKTKKLTHGKISFKSSAAKIEYRDGDAKQFLKRIDEATGLVKKLVALLKRLKIGGVRLGLLLDCKPAVSLSSIKDAWIKGDLQDEQLRELGLVVKEPEEQVDAVAFEFTIRSASEADLREVESAG